MEIDPRTLQEVVEEADCHLIPKCFGLSNVTIRLDRDFDCKIGYACDEQLRQYLELLFGSHVSGRIALAGGSKSLKGVFSFGTGQVQIPKPRMGKVVDWERKALGMNEGKIQFESFTGFAVDTAAAFASMIHSAFLVLHYHGHEEIHHSRFDKVRDLLKKAAFRLLDKQDLEMMQEMILVEFKIPRNRIRGNSVNMIALREVYDGDFDIGDGFLNDFPKKCVARFEDRFVVTLPYSKSLRAIVTFERQGESA